MQKKPKAGRVLMIPTEQIEPSPYQARTVFDQNEIAALAVSIVQNGLLQPVTVRQLGLKQYQLIAGERRLRACRMANMQKIPAILVEFSDSESAALGLLENIQRTQLDPFDTARGIREVIRQWNCTQAEAARRLGLSQPALANKLRLLLLTKEEQEFCTEHHLSERHARAVLRLTEDQRLPALEHIASETMSVRQAEQYIETLLCPKFGENPAEEKPPKLRTLMVKEVKGFMGMIQHAVEEMTRQGICATTTCGRKNGFLEYTVRIPIKEGINSPFEVPIAVPVEMEDSELSQALFPSLSSSPVRQLNLSGIRTPLNTSQKPVLPPELSEQPPETEPLPDFTQPQPAEADEQPSVESPHQPEPLPAAMQA